MKFARSAGTQASINIAPLVDVVFLLVIFFAVSTTFLETAGLKLELPTSASSTDRNPEELAVFMDSDGKLSVDGDVLTLEQLGDTLRPLIQRSDEKLVTLRADKSAQHGDVVAVIDRIKNAGAAGGTQPGKPGRTKH
jgi:biopolymer transport protein ExbD